MTTFLLVCVIYGAYFIAATLACLLGYTAWHWLTHRRSQPRPRPVEIDFERVTPITAARSYDRTRGAA